MAVEKYSEQINETSIMLFDRVDAVKTKKEIHSAIRAYGDGYIGIASADGENIDETELESKARKNMLDYKIKYNAEPSENRKEIVDKSSNGMTDECFVEEAKDLISKLNAEYPNFTLMNKIDAIEKKITLQNDFNLDLSYKDKYYVMDMAYNFKDSASIWEGSIVNQSRIFNKEEMLNYTRTIFDLYKLPIVDLKKKKYPMIYPMINEFSTMHGLINLNFSRDLHGQYFASKASLLTDKIGEKVFNEHFTLYQSRDPESYIGPFFDAEGVVNENYKYTFIKNGVLLSPYTDKSIAQKYGLPLTGSALGGYNDVPSAGDPTVSYPAVIRPQGLMIEGAGKTIKELLGEEEGIFVFLSLAGNFAVDGKYASVIQAGFYYDGEEFTGRVPPTIVMTDIFKLYGADFRGVAINELLPSSQISYLVADMEVARA